MLSKVSAPGDGFYITLEYPRPGWHHASKVVPWLRSPHELATISNRPLQKVPKGNYQNVPMVQVLDAGAYLIWVYYQVFRDPSIDDPHHPLIPDYTRFSYPFEYSEAQLFPPQLDYEWSRNLLWRRVGLNLPPTPARPEKAALTVMFWEGTRASVADTRVAEAIVRSVSVSAGVLG